MRAPKRCVPETIDRLRAVASLMEELEAVDWYDQRVDAATDEVVSSASWRTTATRKKSTPPWCWSGCVAGILGARRAPAHLPVHGAIRAGYRARSRNMAVACTPAKVVATAMAVSLLGSLARCRPEPYPRAGGRGSLATGFKP